MNSKDITSGRSNILLIGDTGTHKTRFLGSCPKPYVFDFDAGMAINRDRSIEYDTYKDIPWSGFGPKREPNEMEKKAGFYTFGTGWNAFIKKINDIGETMSKGTCPYLTMGLDSITFMSELAMNAVLLQQDKFVIHQGSYGAQQQYIKTVLSQLTAWPIRVVCTAHIQRDKNDITETVEKLPLVTGKLAGFLSAYFDEVYFCESEVQASGEQKFTVKTKATPSMRQAKSRWGVPDGTNTDFAAVEKFFLPQPNLQGGKPA